MNQTDQLDRMIADIKQVIQKNTGDMVGTDVMLEKADGTGKMQITICIKNISDMKIAFRQLPDKTG
ncbi:hypothetical protein JMK90_004550 [Salmonella enterica]|nr:hypothetical protein [Salmonella enterica]